MLYGRRRRRSRILPLMKCYKMTTGWTPSQIDLCCSNKQSFFAFAAAPFVWCLFNHITHLKPSWTTLICTQLSNISSVINLCKTRQCIYTLNCSSIKESPNTMHKKKSEIYWLVQYACILMSLFPSHK